MGKEEIRISLYEWILQAEYAGERGESEFLYSGLYRYMDELKKAGIFSEEELAQMFEQAFLYEKEVLKELGRANKSASFTARPCRDADDVPF